MSTPEREIYRYTVPAGMARRSGIKTIGMVLLTPNDERMATARAGNEAYKLVHELAKAALREVDGKPVMTADGTADGFWERAHPQLRNLIVHTYNSLHNPPSEEVDDFLQSVEVTAASPPPTTP